MCNNVYGQIKKVTRAPTSVGVVANKVEDVIASSYRSFNDTHTDPMTFYSVRGDGRRMENFEPESWARHKVKKSIDKTMDKHKVASASVGNGSVDTKSIATFRMENDYCQVGTIKIVKNVQRSGGSVTQGELKRKLNINFVHIFDDSKEMKISGVLYELEGGNDVDINSSNAQDWCEYVATNEQ